MLQTALLEEKCTKCCKENWKECKNPWECMRCHRRDNSTSFPPQPNVKGNQSYKIHLNN